MAAEPAARAAAYFAEAVSPSVSGATSEQAANIASPSTPSPAAPFEPSSSGSSPSATSSPFANGPLDSPTPSDPANGRPPDASPPSPPRSVPPDAHRNGGDAAPPWSAPPGPTRARGPISHPLFDVSPPVSPPPPKTIPAPGRRRVRLNVEGLIAKDRLAPLDQEEIGIKPRRFGSDETVAGLAGASQLPSAGAAGRPARPAAETRGTGKRVTRGPPPYQLRAVGHSMGGASLLVYAVMCRRLGRPHHIQRLVLLTPAGFQSHLPMVRPLRPK